MISVGEAVDQRLLNLFPFEDFAWSGHPCQECVINKEDWAFPPLNVGFLEDSFYLSQASWRVSSRASPPRTGAFAKEHFLGPCSCRTVVLRWGVVILGLLCWNCRSDCKNAQKNDQISPVRPITFSEFWVLEKSAVTLISYLQRVGTLRKGLIYFRLIVPVWMNVLRGWLNIFSSEYREVCPNP